MMDALSTRKANSNLNNIIIETVNKIKNGDNSLREDFINDFKPYIIKTVSSLSGKYIDVQNSDEFSIGLSAFNEAIDSFDQNKSIMFFTFCKLVIKRRLTDYVRKNNKHNRVYPFTYFEDSGISFFEQTRFKNMFSIHISYEMCIDTKNYIKMLSRFGIKFEDLISSAPKHKDSKYLCFKIAKIIADDKILLKKLAVTKKIPKSELLKLININRKTLERNRVFIIASALILGNDFYSLKEFVALSD
ncbi:RNA polymerase sigma-I factor [Herbivorax sp. ANBcel31]|uniref:RNA polymerase sigma-I factor n=1 Tax=Herbivorax sp. ANBcel31 TaxID=3069754 RepID=UPI0027AF2DCE|nr:RNA polymerase sigma-I factor [Herbivorax sp. ANBcel31]MDQ2086840.1 RNA polymerase sigma-I factor [Herbivorax sp. ANBcel31]